MNNETISLWLTQGGVRLSMTVHKVTVDKMTEIKQRYPEGHWDKKELDLMKIAHEELEQEAKENGTTLPWQEPEKPKKKRFWQK